MIGEEIITRRSIHEILKEVAHLEALQYQTEMWVYRMK
jgi:hypothetical protein